LDSKGEASRPAPNGELLFMSLYFTHARVRWLRAATLSLFAVIGTFASLAAHAVAPTISGSPPIFLGVNDYYWFQPAVSDPDTATSALRFSIANKPSWASFSTTSGKLYGRPTTARTWSSIVISVSDGTATRSLPAFAITASTSAGANNRPPTISGTPPTSATLNVYYKFAATASDPDRNPLTFSIQNKPAWLTFNTRLGVLSGTPRLASDVRTFSNIVIRVSDGRATATLPAFSITVRSSGGGTTNTPPTISGTPPSTARAGTLYSFTPSANDANNDPLTFSVTNKPSWASFSTTTGRLWGTPTAAQVGTYPSVSIRVSDGKATTSLSAFGITVTDSVNGSVTLSWTPPTQNSNGSTLTNLAGYRIYYGTSSSALNQTIQVSNAGTASYVVGNLSPATWYFRVRAYNSAGTESANSNLASRTVN
jgi:hypothetical protein